jgi:hypothetical protein
MLQSAKLLQSQISASTKVSSVTLSEVDTIALFLILKSHGQKSGVSVESDADVRLGIEKKKSK